MSDFFADLDDRRFWSLSKFLTECYDDPRAANVEEALLKLDQLCVAPLKGKDSFIDQCRSRQTDIREELDEYLLERLKPEIPEDSWAALLLTMIADGTTVITTNYDNLAEIALSHRPGLRHRRPDTNCHHCRMCKILNDECAFGNEVVDDAFWRGSLLKLHGSVAWKMCGNADCDASQCLLPDVHCRPFEGEVCDCCDGPCSPVLVHPSMTKTFDRFRGLTRIWEGAFEALKDCRSITFFGFSFPTSDMAISEMIRSTLGRSSGPLQVDILDVCPAAPAQRLGELLTHRSDEVQIREFLVPSDGQVPGWIDTSKLEAASQRISQIEARRSALSRGH